MSKSEVEDAITMPSHFPDLIGKIMSHTWAVLVYALACISAVYALGVYPSTIGIFLVVEIPMLVAVTVALQNSAWTNYHVTFIWVVTGAFIVALFLQNEVQWSTSVVIGSLMVILMYWLIRAVRGTIYESRQLRASLSTPEVIATLLSVWGATIQIATIGLNLLKLPLGNMVAPALRQSVLFEVLNTISLTSPLSYVPLYLVLIGILLFAVLRFKEDPYEPKSFDEVMPIKLPKILEPLIQAVKIPLWIVEVTVGFLSHFLKQIVASLEHFIANWSGRLLLISFFLVIPVITISAAHAVLWFGADLLAGYLNATVISITTALLMLVVIHLGALLALTLYAVSSGQLLSSIKPCSIKQAWLYIVDYTKDDGSDVANSLVRTFSLFGVVFIAVPVGTLIPGGTEIGAFSIAYILLIGGVLNYSYHNWQLSNPDTNEHAILTCNGCGRKMRVPSNLHIRGNCPSCNMPYEARDGVYHEGA